MELHHLRTFVAVAEEGSVTGAAQRLYLTPPTVSAHIKALEEALGITLFERSALGMALTEKGEVLKVKAEATLFAAQDLVNHATNLQTHLMGQVNLGLCASADYLRIPELTHYLSEHFPGIGLNLVSRSSGEIIDAVQAHKLDAGFIFGPVVDTQFESLLLTTAQLRIAIPTALKPELITWETLAELPWVHTSGYCPFQTLTEQVFGQQGFEVKQYSSSDDDQTRLSMVRAGVGASLLRREVAADTEQAGSVITWGDSIACPLRFIYLSARQHEPLLASLVNKAIPSVWAKRHSSREKQ